jgi:hypothetical protein
MNQGKRESVSRRDFARRAILFSATASLVPGAFTSVPSIAGSPLPQDQPNLPKLSPAGQAEADARLQYILAIHGSDLDDSQKALLKSLCVMLQPSLEHLRSFALQNGDVPALFLKPLVEHEKKPLAAPHATGAPRKP